MRITSPAFENEQPIPDTYTCDGENNSPPLLFLEVPKNAKSLSIIMHDPDAVSGDFVHWILYNIDPSIKEIKEDGELDGSIEGKNSAGTLGYKGPCPPSGEHRYIFELYALDLVLDLPPGATREELEKEMEGHILEQVELMGLYSRD